MRSLSLVQRLLTVAAVLLVLGAAAVSLAVRDGARRSLVVHFPNTIGLYVGDDVRVLGVPVGSITSVVPEKDFVRVELDYRSDVPLPADVRAAGMAPTLITGRFVQLSPAYRGGPRLDDGAEVPIERTAVPVEWDEIKQQLSTLTGDLGPDGVGSTGALGRVLDTTARNLDGQGTDVNQTLQQLSQAMTTLSDGRTDLFATVRNLQVFVSTLAQSDQQVDRFTTQLAAVSRVLADNRTQLSTTLSTLDSVLPLVQGFVADNRDRLSSDIGDLGRITTTLSDNRQALADILQVAPTAVSDFNNAYDPFSASLTGVLAFSNLRDPASFICSTIFSAGGTPEQCRSALGPLGRLAQTDNLPVTASPLERNGREHQVMPDGSPVAGADPGPALLPGLEQLLTPGGSR